ncbi:MAG: DUF4097 family beta strand repeat-containing protein [Vicinamibacterales bacterium]
MPISRISRFVLAFALVAGPAQAAVTVRGAVPDDNPRAGWLDRYSETRQGPETVDKIAQTLKVGTDGALDLTNISGDVRITGGPGTEIKIDATKRVRHRDADEAKRLLGELRVEITNVNGRVEVRTIYPRRRGDDHGVSARVDYLVSVPVGASVTTRNISGNIIVTNVKGEVRIETISGDLDVSSTPNLALAKTVSGNVRARDIGGATTLTLGTVSGTLIASGLKVRALECGSVSGDMQLSGLQVERIEAKSVSGNIEFDAPLTRGGRYEFASHSGNIRLVLAPSSGFDLDATTFSGSIRSDLPVTLRSTGDEPGGRRGSPSRSIRGSYGDGGAVLAVRSFSGSVVILKK